LYNSVKNEQLYDSKLFQIHITEMKQRQRHRNDVYSSVLNIISTIGEPCRIWIPKKNRIPSFREPQPCNSALPAPTTLAVLGMNLAKSMGFSPMLGGGGSLGWGDSSIGGSNPFQSARINTEQDMIYSRIKGQILWHI
jgi:hypothetical protein